MSALERGGGPRFHPNCTFQSTLPRGEPKLRRTWQRHFEKVGGRGTNWLDSFLQAHRERRVSANVVRKPRVMAGDAISQQLSQLSQPRRMLCPGCRVIDFTRDLHLLRVVLAGDRAIQVILEGFAVLAEVVPPSKQARPLLTTEVFREVCCSHQCFAVTLGNEPRAPPWDQGIAWNVMTDAPVAHDGAARVSSRRPWMLWHRCFALDVEASNRLVLGLRQVSARDRVSLREAGFATRAFSVAYQHAKDDAHLKSIEVVLEHLEAAQDEKVSPDARLSAAIDCGGAAGRVLEPMATRLRTFAARQDQAFCALPHDLKHRGGFAISLQESAGKADDEHVVLTPLWHMREDGRTTALVAMMCVSRYENTGDIRYRELIGAAADAYQRTSPPDDADIWPMTFGHAISLQLAAWRCSARQEYLDYAVTLANRAIELFWQGNPLPRGSSMSHHYESAKGADTLVLALVELHLSILHITAVRCPPNTIDR